MYVCLIVCNLETSTTIGRTEPKLGCCATGRKFKLAIVLMSSNNTKRQLLINFVYFACRLCVASLKLTYVTGITDPLSHPIIKQSKM